MIACILFESAYEKNDSDRGILYLIAILGLGSAGVFAYQKIFAENTFILGSALAIDSFSSTAKVLMIIGTIGALYLSKISKDIYQDLKGEFVIMSTGVLVGGCLLASANNMLILYIGIETLSILSYVMASFKKTDDRSSEAGLKYVLYGGVSAAVMLFGMSHIYGVLGTINFQEMATALSGIAQSYPNNQLTILIPSFILFIAGIGYKISSVPFHMWTPDVYEGSPMPVTTFFSIVPKIAGITILLRVSSLFFSESNLLSVSWFGIISSMSILTITVGNIAAIGQRSVKRMLAYSSISHAGMMMLGIVVLNTVGMRSILFYAVTYIFMTLVAFYILSIVNDEYDNDHFERFSGLIYKKPLMAILMAVTMFSLAGIPPLSGFVAKFHILNAVVKEGYYTLAILAGLNSVISLYYYLKIVRLMVFKPYEGSENLVGFGVLNQTIVTVLFIPIVMLGIFWAGTMAKLNLANILMN
jgi:NADH-quinone oxidoreductase subunit N